MNERLYLRTDFRDSIQNRIINSEIARGKRDIDTVICLIIFLKLILENHYDLPLDALVQQHFYKSLGANFSTYKPLEKFNKNQLFPLK